MAAERPRVVIVGGGFGGLFCAQRLAGAELAVTLVDQRNHHLFQPLLYQVATAGLSPADIATPIRSILRDQANARVLLDQVTGVDTADRQVLCASGRRIGYDWLVLATGARHGYFGHDEWAPHAPGLKSVEDATGIRRRILLAFEHAEVESDPAARERLMTFVLVGAGPTGVELAGALAELARKALARDFRHIRPGAAQVILVEAGERVLGGFAPAMSARARRDLKRLGVTVRTGAKVTAVTEAGVAIDDTLLPAATVLWAAGVTASPAARWLGLDGDRAGRVKVAPDLTVPEHDRIFVIGDTASVQRPDGHPVPGIAPAAKQMGDHVGRLIRARALGERDPGPFRYRHQGDLATIGRNRAVADFGWLRLTGFLGWVLWCVAHVFFLIGFRNRIMVSIHWLWAYATFQRGARLITRGPGGN